MTAVLVAVVIIVALAAALAGASIRVLREYERAVVFRLGRLIGQKGPGIVLLIPIVDRMVRVDLRSVLGKADLDMLLAEREQLNESLQQIIDDQTDPWGVKVTTVEIKDVGIPQGMQRAMARQAEAERERRAKVINAEGEFQASERLFDAAEVMSGNPAALQLRYLQTLLEIGTNQNSTIVLPVPIDLIKPLMQSVEDGNERRERARRHERELDEAEGRLALSEADDEPALPEPDRGLDLPPGEEDEPTG
jgi:regulator of protease activity HflC (stomatin/prohibitin superfamily)